MNKIKSFFSNPKKAVTAVVVIIAAVAVLGVGITYAARTTAENTSIGAENAQNFAFVDAGVDPASAQVVRTEFDHEHGQFVYEVEFIADGTEYDYWIKASDGSVVRKDMELINTMVAGGTTADTNMPDTAANAGITIDQAKETALADAGVNAADATFVKEIQDTENGVAVYDLEFYAGNTEYEYEINVETGAIYSKSKETNVQPDGSASGQPAQQDTTAKETAPKETTPKETTPKETKPKETKPKETAAKNENTQSNTAPKETAAQQQSSGQSASGSVTLDAAKEKALADAGVNASDATFTKQKQDYDDGILVYDIEFYTSSAEYDYEIDATTGAVHSKSIEKFGGHSGNGSAGANNAAGSTGSNNSAGSNGSASAGSTSSNNSSGSTGSNNSAGSTGSGSSGSTGSAGSTGGTDIGLDAAKATAASHAGYSVSDVNFSKAKLDFDDGYTVYEIEFYKNGVEYEYKINAQTGAIMEYDSDYDD